MKFKNLETNSIIEVTDKQRIAKFKGYPDKFEAIIEEKKEIPKTGEKTEKKK
jgi:hypothetical protein